MKHFFTLAFTVFTLFCNAQLNYNFSAVPGTYTPVTGGTVAPLSLTSTGTGYTDLDEGYSNNIPIGFSFLYNGTSYSVIHAGTNGFAVFGTAFVTDNSPLDRGYYLNNLVTSNSPFYDNSAQRPVLAPLWDDLGLTSANGISYVTTGSAPNRVFTLQWAAAEWPNGPNGTPDISFQIKLYETTNVVEFIYQQEIGALNRPSASIGITAAATGTDNFLSLNNTTASPAVSSTMETKNLSAKPATGQVYRFSPTTCAPPLNFRVPGYNHNSATVSWNAPLVATTFEYAITTSSTPPASGTTTSDNAVTVAALSPSTVYYAYVRNTCGTSWRFVSFKTASTPVSTPFADGFETSIEPQLPADWREENISDPAYGDKWISYEDPSLAASGDFSIYTGAYFGDADFWAYTPSLTLTAGTQYRLRFKYTTYDGIHTLVVKMGSKVGSDSMLTTLFNKNDIDLNGPFTDTTINFTVPYSATWYVGFNYKTPVANNPNFGILVLDDVSVEAAAVLPVSLLHFNGTVAGIKHVLSWQTATEKNVNGFELQHSSNGVDFERLSFARSKAISGYSNERLSYSYDNDRLFAGKNYYRLKTIDRDGKFNFSAVVILQNDKVAWTALVFPNPVKDRATILVNTPVSQRAQMNLYTADGKLAWTKNEMLQKGQQSVTIRMHNLQSGTYRLVINGTVPDKISLSIIKQ